MNVDDEGSDPLGEKYALVWDLAGKNPAKCRDCGALTLGQERMGLKEARAVCENCAAKRGHLNAKRSAGT